MMIFCTFQGADKDAGLVQFHIARGGCFKRDTTIEMHNVSRCLIHRIRQNRDKVFRIDLTTNKIAILGAR